MRLAKLVLAFLFATVAAAAAYQFCWQRYRCNVERKFIDVRLHDALTTSSDWVRTQTGRMTAEQLKDCIANNPADSQAVELLAVAYRAAGQQEDALSAYQSALAMMETPQTHVAIASVYLEMGKPEPAYQHLLRAAMFAPLYRTTEYVSLVQQQQIEKDVAARERRIRTRALQSKN